ncbi:hypothetical protein [Hymenobacter metallicola]|uniref:Uncharacterized protein n=1 Tax=Hymenobacter metallicola TaxID=2563114 RepID=A0A4Z0QAL5_9BACT|nr:hypothetical protein [Hymenobacter metallicola]TGE26183.1 hypothetical protein E5K02_15325 [Hymenobacter metallicola]
MESSLILGLLFFFGSAMNDVMLRAKHWQVFLYILPILILANITIVDSPLLSNSMSALAYGCYFTWFALLGNRLFLLLPRNVDFSLTWFLVDTVVVIATFAATVILTDDRSFQGEGLMALPVFYVFFAAGHTFWFLAATLVAVEKRRRPEFGFYFGTLLLFLFWPIGVWFIQPRLNKVWKEQE